MLRKIIIIIPADPSCQFTSQPIPAIERSHLHPIRRPSSRFSVSDLLARDLDSNLTNTLYLVLCRNLSPRSGMLLGIQKEIPQSLSVLSMFC
jgi:hypothetical protein